MKDDLSSSRSIEGGSSKNLLDRRSMLQMVGVGALTFGISEAWLRYRLHTSLELSRKLFGTLKNPKFQVQEALPIEGIDTYSGRLRLESKDFTPEQAASYNKSLNSLRTSIDKIEGFVRETSETPNDSQIKKLNALQDPLRKIKTELDDIDLEIYTKLSTNFLLSSLKEASLRDIDMLTRARSLSERLAEMGAPEDYLRAIVRKTTGLDLPNDVRLGVRSIDREGIKGISHIIGLTAEAEDSYYIDVVLTLAHESGHLMSGHQEEFLSENKFKRTESEVTSWEEACAYAYENVVAAHLKLHADGSDGIIASALATSSRNWLLGEYYSRSEHYLECHREGMAIFDAALTVLKDFGKAYNFLSSNVYLTPAMLDVLQKNRDLYLEVSSNSTVRSDTIKADVNELRSRVKRISELVEQRI